MDDPASAVVLISAQAEWTPVRRRYAPTSVELSPFGEQFIAEHQIGEHSTRTAFVQGGWGKIAAAASTQYAIDRWQPRLVINLGTCGGFVPDVTVGTVLLADFTLVYDILEQMGDPDEALAHYATPLDLDWLPEDMPSPVLRTLLVSADRDIVPAEVEMLRARYGAIAADWESGAIAYVCARNSVRCLILRAVSDLVSSESGEVYDRADEFEERAATLMVRLLDSLPGWVAAGLARTGERA